MKCYQEWGPVKPDLERMDPQFELLGLVEDAMHGVRDVYRTVLDMRLDEALRGLPTARAALAKIRGGSPEGNPTIYRYEGDWEGATDVSPRLFPVDAIHRLGAVLDGSADRGSLFRQPETDPQLKFDPATVRERFHRDSRGVQALSAWLAGGGPSPDFSQLINEMLQEDRGTGPLITGLLNVSVLLAHMTAGALGATAEGLVAGLLDTYGEYE